MRNADNLAIKKADKSATEKVDKPGDQLPVIPKRREARIPVALNVEVLGVDADGIAFLQAAVTVDISLSGARLSGLTAELHPGDVVGLQSGGAKCHFKVSWTSKNGDGEYQAGLRCQGKEISPWSDTIQAECIIGGNRRNYSRFPCDGSASVHSTALSAPIEGALRVLGSGGCYVQCVNPAPKGDIVSGQFTVDGVQFNAVAEVRISSPSIGMGLLWCDLDSDGQGKLNNLLRTLSLAHGDANSSKAKAVAQLEQLHQLEVALRGRLKNKQVLVDMQMTGRLNDALESLSDALNSVQF